MKLHSQNLRGNKSHWRSVMLIHELPYLVANEALFVASQTINHFHSFSPNDSGSQPFGWIWRPNKMLYHLGDWHSISMKIMCEFPYYTLPPRVTLVTDRFADMGIMMYPHPVDCSTFTCDMENQWKSYECYTWMLMRGLRFVMTRRDHKHFKNDSINKIEQNYLVQMYSLLRIHHMDIYTVPKYANVLAIFLSLIFIFWGSQQNLGSWNFPNLSSIHPSEFFNQVTHDPWMQSTLGQSSLEFRKWYMSYLSFLAKGTVSETNSQRPCK